MRSRNMLVAVGWLAWSVAAMAQPPGYVADPAALPPGGPPAGYPAGSPLGITVGDGLPAETPPIPESWLNSAFNPQPLVEARVEAVFYKVDFPESPSLAAEYRVNAQNAVEQFPLSADRGRDYTTAIRGALDFHFNEFKSMELVGFYFMGPDSGVPLGSVDTTKFLSSGGAQTPVNERGFLTNLPAGFPTVADTLRLDWDFASYGAEFNFLHHFICPKGPVSDLAIGLGGRYFHMQEKVTLTAINELDNQIGRLRSESENSLAGPQIIFRGRVQTPLKRWRATAEGKIGFMANSAVDDTALSVGNADNRIGFRQTETRFAPLFEGNFGFEYLLFNHMTLFGGYQILFIDRVDRAVERLSPDLNAYGGPQREIGSLLMMGPRAGVVIHY